MTWLSRLLPTSPRRHRRPSNHHARSPRDKGRRRVVTLEPLEHRTVLSNISVSFTLPGTLTILGDTHSESFAITEGAGGIVTVASSAKNTTINGSGAPFVSDHAVTTINVTLPGNSSATDNVTLTSSLGSAVKTTVRNVTITTVPPNATNPGPNLRLTVGGSAATGVNNSGALTVNANNSQLLAVVDSSTFSAIAITQTGCCPAHVTLTNDVAGPVTVSEGNRDGNTIVLDGDAFGSTVLVQGNSPPISGPCNGVGDSISVTNSSVRDLVAEQLLSGVSGQVAGQTITVDTVSVSLTSFGVQTSQADGNGDITTVNAITTAGVVNPNRLGNGPPSILIVQGDGASDTASATNSVLPGDITIQQGDGFADVAAITGDTIGITVPFGPFLLDFFGLAAIIQGNGVHDIAVLNADAVNNVLIVQGLGGNAESNGMTCPADLLFGGVGDIAEVNGSTVTSDITILQGFVLTGGTDVAASPALIDEAGGVGNNVAAIGYDYLGNNGVALPPSIGSCCGGSAPVTAGGNTVVIQGGGGNSVYLGDANGSSFTTDTLDVFAGAGGGAFVQAYNTTAFSGSLFGNPFEIDAGGTGNVFDDQGGNTNVFASANFVTVPT